jgi:hypothetical protein
MEHRGWLRDRSALQSATSGSSGFRLEMLTRKGDESERNDCVRARGRHMWADNPEVFKRCEKADNLFGEGQAASKQSAVTLLFFRTAQLLQAVHPQVCSFSRQFAKVVGAWRDPAAFETATPVPVPSVRWFPTTQASRS